MPVVSEMRFGAKLLPDHENIGKGCGDVGGLIGAFITERLRPAVLMLVADEVAVGVVMALPHVKCVDAPLSTVNDGKGQRRGKSIIAAADDQGVARIACYRCDKLDGGAVILIVPPGDVSINDLGFVLHDGRELGVRDKSPPPVWCLRVFRYGIRKPAPAWRRCRPTAGWPPSDAGPTPCRYRGIARTRCGPRTVPSKLSGGASCRVSGTNLAPGPAAAGLHRLHLRRREDRDVRAAVGLHTPERVAALVQLASLAHAPHLGRVERLPLGRLEAFRVEPVGNRLMRQALGTYSVRLVWEMVRLGMPHV